MSNIKIIRAQAGFQEKFVSTNVDFAVGGGVLACGKMMPLDTQVLTPNGFVMNGDLNVGDYVSTPFGEPSKILKIFEHKGKDIYRLATSDGRTAECGLEHLWAIRTTKQLEKFRKDGIKGAHFTVCDTSVLIERLRSGKKSYIPIPDAQEFGEKKYAIHPYVIGVMIGDGCLTESTWKGDTAIYISNTERDIIEKVSALCESTGVYEHPNCNTKKIYTPMANVYKQYCNKVGLNVHSYEKFIPEEYLYGSIRQRKELLAGLFDTDGSVSKKGSYSFSTTSRRLMDDFVFLCRSLGYIATVSDDNRNGKYTSGESFNITIQTDEKIFTSRKHEDRWNSVYSKEKKFIRKRKHVYVTSIEKVRVSDARCILIEDPLHLYIAGDFITTHNTYAAVLSVAEPSLDGNFRGLFLRNNLGDARAAGGILDTFKEAYGNSIKVVESGEPRVEFTSGARIDVTHVSDQSYDKIMQRFKGRQYDFIYFDEGTGFTWECFTAIYTRNRGKAKWTGKVRMTTNPERDHWLRKFIDWYIGIDGFIREDRNGAIRYFYMAGNKVDDVVWGDSKEEVYGKCKIDIDRKLAKINGKDGDSTWKDLIKSFTFYLGRMSENKATIGKNGGYVGSVAVTGGASAQQLLEGNWNVSTKNDEDALVKQEDVEFMFQNDPQTNGDKWVTCDLADTGTDNFIAMSWDGFHIEDILIVNQSTPRENALMLKAFAGEHGISDSHIIYDAVRGTYINDYIQEAKQFVSYRAPIGLYGRMAQKLKDECYLRVVECINRHNISCSDKVAKKTYEHAKLKSMISVMAEIIEECSVIRFRELGAGKKTLLSKKEMNQKLGKSRSMDVLDNFSMRMLPYLEYAYGEELSQSMKKNYVDEREDDEDLSKNECNVYDDSFWC